MQAPAKSSQYKSALWLSAWLQGRPLRLSFRARYGQPAYRCTIQSAAAAAADGIGISGSRYSRCPPALSGQHSDHEPLVVRFEEPMRAITPGQV